MFALLFLAIFGAAFAASPRRTDLRTPHRMRAHPANQHLNLTSFKLAAEAITCSSSCLTKETECSAACESGECYSKCSDEYETCIIQNCPVFNYCENTCSDKYWAKIEECQDKCDDSDNTCYSDCYTNTPDDTETCITSCVKDTDEDDLKDYQSDCKDRCKDEFSDEDDIAECQHACTKFKECPFDSHSDYLDDCKKDIDDECGDDSKCKDIYEDYCEKMANAICPKSKWWIYLVIGLAAAVVVGGVVAGVLIYLFKCRKGGSGGNKVAPSDTEMGPSSDQTSSEPEPAASQEENTGN